MNVRKTVKKIVAIAAGATMLGATIFGASAATYDLSKYPYPFVKDGKFTGYIVVGDDAAPKDIVGAIDIANSLQFASTSAASDGGTTVSVTGDNAKFATNSDILEIYENLQNVKETFTADDLDALKGGVLSTSEGTTDYNQYLRFKDATVTNAPFDSIEAGVTIYDENEEDKVGDYLYFASGDQIFEYELEFEEGAESRYDATTGDLVDLEDEMFNILGVEFAVVDTDFDGANSLTVELMSGSVRDTLQEGETKTYTVDGKDYEVEVLIIADGPSEDTTKVKFRINDEVTDELTDGETDVLDNGMTIGIREILPNEAGEVGVGDLVEFYLGANKVTLTDNDATGNTACDEGGTEINNEQIEDSCVAMKLENSVGTKYKLYYIKYLLTADSEDGDVYVEPGHKLSEYLEEPEGMLHDQWDIMYAGITPNEFAKLELIPSGDDEYRLKFENAAGKTYTMDLIEYSAPDTLYIGSDGEDALHYQECADSSTFCIEDDDYFILTDDCDQTGYTWVFKYQTIDETNKIITFQDLAGGTKKVPYEDVGGGVLRGDLVVGGKTFRVYVENGAPYRLSIDQVLNGCDDGNVAGGLGIAGEFVPIVVNGGGIFYTEDTLPSHANGDWDWEFFVPAEEFDTTVYDKNGAPNIVASLYAADFANAGGFPGVLSIPITIDDRDTVDELGLDVVPGNFFDFNSPEDNDELKLGMDSYGTLWEWSDESGTDDSEKLVINFPKTGQRNSNVYIVAAGASASTTAGGKVVVNRIQVGAAKLASEIANPTAQNLIVVGDAAVNKVAADLMGLPYPTYGSQGNGVPENGALLKLIENGDKVALIVAGWEAPDTYLATSCVSDLADGDGKCYGKAISGTEVWLEGTSTADFTVSKPTA